MRHFLGLAALGILMGAAGCGGGSRKTYVTNYPRWDFEEYQRIAVAPVSATDPAEAACAERLTDALTSLLSGNDAFTVLSRAELARIMTEQDLARLSEAVDPSTAMPEGKIEIAQAMVVPKLTEFAVDREVKEIRIEQYARDPRGRVVRDRAGRPVVSGYTALQRHRHWGRVAGSVQVIDTATSRVLFSYSSPPIEHSEDKLGGPPRVSPEEAALLAAQELATDLYKQVAPTRIPVKLDKDMLLVALDYFEGEYETAKKLPSGIEQFMLVVRDLPAACDRNTFRVAILEKEGRDNLFEEEFVWPGAGSTGQRGLVFQVPMGPLAATHAEEFTAKLYSAGEDAPILWRDFSVEYPEAQQ